MMVITGSSMKEPCNRQRDEEDINAIYSYSQMQRIKDIYYMKYPMNKENTGISSIVDIAAQALNQPNQ